MLKIVHVINSLDTGGAETVLLRLLAACDHSKFDNRVVSLTDLGPISADLANVGVQSQALGIGRTGFLPNPLRAMKLANIIRATDADIVQTWMYHSNLIGGVSALIAGRPPVIWGVRQINLDRESVPLRTAVVARLSGWASARLADKIVYNSATSRRSHEAMGYHGKTAQVISNGFDTEIFSPDTVARASVRAELGISKAAVIVGLLGRYNSQKDHGNFIRAAASVHGRHHEVEFVMAGLGVDQHNDELMHRIQAAGLSEVCHLLGHRTDIPNLAASFDVGCLSSMGEGFPNVVGEMMACGVPCAATNVGDIEILVGDTGRVVEPRDSGALATAISELIELGDTGRRELGARGRKRVENMFGIQRMVNAFEAVWRDVAAVKNSAHGP
jgi:glycosyltransferase involved in cell wall biosynthesis